MLSARPSRRTSAPVCRRPGGGAFTLVELLTVMGVIAILVGLASGMIRSGKERAHLARARGELAALAQALEAYKNHYGDYPQTGNAAQAPIAPGAPIAQAQAQALLFNALTGVYGPTNFNLRLNGPSFIELPRFRVESPVTILENTFGVPQGTPPAKQVVAAALVDPWGNRYQYYYKAAPLPGRPPVNTWQRSGYLLYSAGPDGRDTPPNRNTGLFNGTTAQTSGFNADNLYANP